MSNLKTLLTRLLILSSIVILCGSFIKAFVISEARPSETILIEYGNTEYYYLLADNGWIEFDNGNTKAGAPYDYILLEDTVIFYVLDTVTNIEVIHGAGDIQYINDAHFIYHGEINDHITLKITY